MHFLLHWHGACSHVTCNKASPFFTCPTIKCARINAYATFLNCFIFLYYISKEYKDFIPSKLHTWLHMWKHSYLSKCKGLNLHSWLIAYYFITIYFSSLTIYTISILIHCYDDCTIYFCVPHEHHTNSKYAITSNIAT